MAEPRNPDRALVRRLRRDRPRPSREFSLSLEDRLWDARTAFGGPSRLWPSVVAYVVCGVVLLALALVGALGGGPFG